MPAGAGGQSEGSAWEMRCWLPRSFQGLRPPPTAPWAWVTALWLQGMHPCAPAQPPSPASDPGACSFRTSRARDLQMPLESRAGVHGPGSNGWRSGQAFGSSFSSVTW